LLDRGAQNDDRQRKGSGGLAWPREAGRDERSHSGRYLHRRLYGVTGEGGAVRELADTDQVAFAVLELGGSDRAEVRDAVVRGRVRRRLVVLELEASGLQLRHGRFNVIDEETELVVAAGEIPGGGEDDELGRRRSRRADACCARSTALGPTSGGRTRVLIRVLAGSLVNSCWISSRLGAASGPPIDLTSWTAQALLSPWGGGRKSIPQSRATCCTRSNGTGLLGCGGLTASSVGSPSVEKKRSCWLPGETIVSTRAQSGPGLRSEWMTPGWILRKTPGSTR
jgi:hypothetical protein